MAARCASCSYPLSVSDSVRCCECSSYFHIDCAQLVGFPYYELSSDPLRNTFHCQTCKILPLPRRSDSDSDTDSEDGAMPSRHLDYLDGQQDLAKEMNEAKGAVQDLSDLCKDMFREISELKSINLTLRCCVENLRHDSEKQNEIISDLKRRIEALERKRDLEMFQPIEITSKYTDVISPEKEDDTERYLTPDPEYSRLREAEEGIVNEGKFHKGTQLLNKNNQNENKTEFSIETYTDNIVVNANNQNWEPSESTIYSEKQDLDERLNYQGSEGKVNFAEEEIIYSTEAENTETPASENIEKWSWRGNEAVQLKNSNDSSEEEDQAENDTTDIEDTDDQGWEILEEDVKSGSTKKEEGSKSDGYLEDSEKNIDERRVTWADNLEKYDQEDETEISSEDITERLVENTEYAVESDQAENGSQPPTEEEETEGTNENETEVAERTSLHDEDDLDKPRVEDSDIVDAVVEVEDYIKKIYTGTDGSRLEEEVRLEGDSAPEEGAVPEGVEGGQSPDQGEVQPSESPEGSEPPPPPQPQHSPDDLWDYLKETVTGEHPATVEEFVQKLIGTLEHVPEEYLKPVIDYNIKRATSPSVTDGENLETKEEDQNTQVEGQTEEILGSEVHPQENGDLLVEGKDHVTDGETLPAEGERVTPEGTPSIHDDTGFPQEPSESAEGFSALQAES